MAILATDSRSLNDASGTQFDSMSHALVLAECATPRALRERVAVLLRSQFTLQWVACLYLEESGRWLGIDGQQTHLACDDFRHPYAHAFRRGEPMRVGVSEACTRLDHPEFLAQMDGLPAECHLELRPLRVPEGERKWLGMLALAGNPAALDRCVGDAGYLAFEALLSRLWQSLLLRQGVRGHVTRLHQSLTLLSDTARRQAQAEELAADLLGGTSVMQGLRQKVVRAAETRLAVLLQGETGTGKDHVARAIHRLSGRRNGPFIALNCAAIPEALLESELFGYSKGAFSGADRDRDGLIAQSSGGTLFLDEIGDMPLALQAKLLRVLESGRFRPLGAAEECQADLRVVAATHQPLREAIRENTFRADLYYRLGQFPITLPSLRDRRDDIPCLAEAFVRDFSIREGRDEMGITPAALRRIRQRDYPGNLRELRNLIDYACAMTPEGGDIEPSALPGEEPDTTSVALGLIPPDQVQDLRQALREYEGEVIRRRLRCCEGNLALAAESLGLPRRTLAHKCRLLKLVDR